MIQFVSHIDERDVEVSGQQASVLPPGKDFPVKFPNASQVRDGATRAMKATGNEHVVKTPWKNLVKSFANEWGPQEILGWIVESNAPDSAPWVPVELTWADLKNYAGRPVPEGGTKRSFATMLKEMNDRWMHGPAKYVVYYLTTVFAPWRRSSTVIMTETAYHCPNIFRTLWACRTQRSLRDGKRLHITMRSGFCI